MTTFQTAGLMFNGTSMAAEVNMGVLRMQAREAGATGSFEFTRRRDIESVPGRFAYDVCSGLHHMLVEMPGQDLRDLEVETAFSQRVHVEGEACSWAQAVRHLADWMTS